MNITAASVQDAGLNSGQLIAALVWRAAPWTVLAAAIGLLIAVILVIYLAKRQLLRRHSALWNALAKLSYVAILVLLPLGAGSLGGLHGVQNALNSVLDTKIKPLVTAYMPQVRLYLVQGLRQAGATRAADMRQMLKPLKEHFSYVAASSGPWEGIKSYWINDVMVAPAFEMIALTAENSLRDRLTTLGATVVGNDAQAQLLVGLGTTVLMHKESDDHADERRLDLELTQVVMDTLAQRLSQGFSPFYLGIFLSMLGIGCLLTAEIIIYHRYFRAKYAGTAP